MSSSLDENAHRAALRRYAVPGTLPEEPFDRVTRLAARWFDAPIALIAMANAEGQWIMSCYGLDERETPREVSFCAHTIQGPGVMVVENATEDERFADDPLVTDAPGIRFYAGVPLVTSDGHRIGALCVIDTEPRHLDDPDARDVLQDLAAMAMDEIEMRVAHPHHGDILESITDAFFALDDAWRFTYVNQQAETLLQRTRNELLGKNVWDEFPEAVERDFYEQYHRAMREGESVQFEAYFPPLEAWFHVNTYPFEGGLSVYFDDITERKAAEQDLEQSLERNRQILQTTIDGYMMYDVTGAIVDVNPAYCDMVGYAREELLDMSLMDVETRLSDEEVLDRLSRFVDGEFDATGPKRFETQHRHKEGRSVDVEVSVGVVEDGERRLLHAFVRNITARKRAEQSLREHEERLASINNHVQEGIYRSTPAEGLVYINEAFAQLFGYDAPDDLLALDDLSQLYARPEKRNALVRRVHENESFRHEEVEFQRADGSTFWGLISATTTFGENGAVIHRDGAVLDITDRKQVEDALREREEYLSVTLRSIGDAVLATDADGRVTEMNPIAEELTGWSLADAVGQPLDDIFRIHNAKTGAPVENPIEKVLREGQTVGLANHTVLTARDGTECQIADSAAPIRTAAGNLLGVVMVFRDVTEKYAREKALRTERDLLAGIFDTSAAAITVLDAEGQILRANERAEEVLGLEATSVEERTYDDPAWKHTAVDGGPFPDEAQPFARVMETEAPVYDVQHAIEWPDGRRRILSINGAPLRDAAGTVTGGVFIVDDVTEKKQREQALRKERQRLELALIGGDLGLWDLNYNTNRNRVNDRWAEMLGLAPDEVEPTYAFFEARVHPDDRPRLARAMDQHVHGDAAIMEAEIRMRHADGSWRWILDRGKVLEWNDDGSPRRAVGTHLDITERKEQERALRERTIALEQAQAMAKTGSGTINLVDNTIALSEEAGRLLGLDPSVEQPISAFMELVHPDDLALVQREFERVRAGEAHDEAYRIIPAGSDTVRWLRSQGYPEADETGTVTRVFSTIADVTEQKEREKQLRRRRDLLKQTQRLAGAWEYDIESGTLLWSNEVYRIHEVPPGTDILLEEGINYYAPDARSTIRSAVQQCVDERTPWDLELPIITAKGNRRWVRTVGAPIVRDDEVIKLAGAFQDVTERKRAERALERSLAEKQRILETTLDGYMLHDMDGIIVDVNPAYCAMVGYDRDTLIGMDIRDLDVRFTSEALDRRIANYPDVVEYRFETQHAHREGHRVDLDVSAVMMEDEQGRRLVNAFVRDITARKAAEQALRESEERYRTLVERSHDAIYIYRGTRLLFVNNRVCELTGYAEDELLNMNVFKLVHPDDRAQVRQHAIQRVEGSAPSRYEARLVRKDGRVRYGDFSVQAITYQGEYAAIGSIRDVTQRRRVEQALRESEQRFRTLAEETTDVVTRLAPDGTQLYVSPAVQDVLGYAPDELTGTPYQTLIHPDDRAQVEAQVDAARREGKKALFEYRVQHAEGHYVWVETAGQHIPGDGREATLIASTRSVAERKAAEQALVRREQRVESLYKAMQELTAARTREQVAEHILALIDGTLDYPISAVRYQMGANRLVPVAISAQSQALMPERPDYDLAGNSLVAQAFRRGDTARYRDVREQNLPYDFGPVRAAAYVPIGSYGIISVGSLQVDAIDDFDLKLIEILARNAEGVLERIDREDALREARDEAEEMSRLKSAFLANMSHEIRTPLTSIIGFAEVLGEQDLGRADQFAALIQRGGQRLLDTLNSVLDLSQLEAGSMRLAPKRMEVRGAVQSAVQFFTPKAHDKDITLTLDAPDEPIPAVLDEPALHRILNNLLSNAVKFTSAGGRVDVRLDPHPAHLVLQVEDTGVGIEEDFLPHLFDAFKQESSGDARAFEGSGLGLTITRQLVHLMDGEVAVSTEKGEGTQFVVRLPYRMERDQDVEA